MCKELLGILQELGLESIHVLQDSNAVWEKGMTIDSPFEGSTCSTYSHHQIGQHTYHVRPHSHPL